MNSLDKSISPLSPELRRVFTIVEMPPDDKALQSALEKNTLLPPSFIALTMGIWRAVNNALYEYVGKEYMLGQGYMWDIVMCKDAFETTLADVLRYKILPHIKDVFPEEKLQHLFGVSNIGILFDQTLIGNELRSTSDLTNQEIITAFANAFGLSYSPSANTSIEGSTFEQYVSRKIEDIYSSLTRYKNVILTGVSGTGKTAILEAVASKYFTNRYSIMHWHNSTSYVDVIEGISAEITEDNKDVDYSYCSGIVKKLADTADSKPVLMGIECLDKSNASENFGELITLLEPDKRKDLRIEGMNGYIQLPENMYFLCTMSPLSLARNKMDSALKRRFVIMELHPDYKLLELWFGLQVSSETYVVSWNTREERLRLSIELLKSINQRLAKTIGSDSQIGHAVLWELKHSAECSLSSITAIFDEKILPMLEDICTEEELAESILGSHSPLIKKHDYGIELLKFATLTEDKWAEVFEELISNEI